MSPTLSLPGGRELPVTLGEALDRDRPLAVAPPGDAGSLRALGFGQATVELSVELPARAPFAAPLPPGRVREIAAGEASPMLGAVWEAVRRGRPGMLDLPAPRTAPGAHTIVCETDAGVDGLAVFDVDTAAAGRSGGAVTVELLLAASPGARVRLWRHLLDLEMPARATVRASGLPVDEPLPFLLANARDALTEVREGAWVRIVDVPVALAGRAYAEEGRLVLDVEDQRCPWNAARFELAAGPGAATCRRTDAAADLRVGVDALASAYLGGHRWATLAGAGRVRELRPGSLALAGAMFLAEAEPWCPAPAGVGS